MTELPVAIIFDNVKLALALIRLSLNPHRSLGFLCDVRLREML